MAGLLRRVTGKLFSSKRTPVRTTTQAAQVRERQYGGSTKAMAADFGVAPRTVERWLKGDRTPRGKDAARLEAAAAAAQTTERGRERRARQVEAQPEGSMRLRVTRSGSFTVRGSSAIRPRPVMLSLTSEQAGRVVRAQSDEDVKDVAAEALLDYFNGGGAGVFGSGDIDFGPEDVELL